MIRRPPQRVRQAGTPFIRSESMRGRPGGRRFVAAVLLVFLAGAEGQGQIAPSPVRRQVAPIDTSRLRLGESPNPVSADHESPTRVRIDWGCPADAIGYNVHVGVGDGGVRTLVGTVSGDCQERRIANPVKLAERYAAFTEGRPPDPRYAALPDSVTLRSSSVVHEGPFEPGTTYSYTVQARYPDRSSGWGGPSHVFFPFLAPTNFRATLQGSDAMQLTWDAVAKASGYRLTRRSAYRGDETLGANCLTQTSYTDASLSPGSYRYHVSACPLGARASVTAEITAPPPAIVGIADLHSHQHSNLGFGGLLIWGKPFGPMHQALAWDTPAHGPGGVRDVLGHLVRVAGGHPAVTNLMAVLGAGHAVGGYPAFDGWPAYDSYTHQQSYADWLKRAVDGGLRLMVMYAVNSELMCNATWLLNYKQFDPTGATALAAPNCDDMYAVDQQIAQARAMEQYIDHESGGPGTGWYRIVYSAAQARQVMQSGKLAVVLGIEVQSLFNCQVGRFCDAAHVRSQLDRYHQLGVRQIIPIHNTNNQFGGTAIYGNVFNVNNKFLTDQWLTPGECLEGGINFRLSGIPSHTLAGQLLASLPELGAPPVYPNGFGHCNREGLTPLGALLIQQMMHKKMVIDVDHTSQRSMRDIFSLTSQYGYPVVASHTGFIETNVGEKAAEGNKTLSQTAAIVGSGGLLGVILHQGKASEIHLSGSSIPSDCDNSTKTFVQAYRYAAQHAGPQGGVAIGTDFGGMVAGLAPRFGDSPCDGGGPGKDDQANPVTYPFTAYGTGVQMGRAVVGQRQYDINQDGLAHIGLLPDMIHDLRNIGLTDSELAPLFRSAEAYVRMWERIEKINAPGT